jgi:hypothetical protein
LLDISMCVNISIFLLGRNKAYIDALGYKSSGSLKTSRPHGLPL